MTHLMEGFKINRRHFWAQLCLTNAVQLPEGKY